VCQKFIDACLIAKTSDGVSAKTVEWHRLSLQTFTRWLTESDNPQHSPDWTLPMLREYVVFL
jgi:hypothetical protein